MATLAQDNFNRADGNLNGSTMSDGSNTWASSIATWAIATNKANRTAGTNPGVAMCDSMSEVANQQVSGECGGDYRNSGPCARLSINGTPAETSYRNISTGSTVFQLGKVIAGSATQLGSNGSYQSSTVHTIKCDGTSISLILDGTTKIGPITDSAISTGRAGIWSSYSTTNDNFLAESLAAASSIVVLRRRIEG